MIHQEERKVYDFHCDECQTELNVGDAIYCSECIKKFTNDKIATEMGELVSKLIQEVKELSGEISALKRDCNKDKIILDHYNLEEYYKKHPEIKGEKK